MSEHLQQLEQPGLQGPQSGSSGALKPLEQSIQEVYTLFNLRWQHQQTEIYQLKDLLREYKESEERNRNELRTENDLLRRQMESLQLQLNGSQASQQQQTAIDGVIDLTNMLKAKVEGLESHHNASLMRYVRCYAIA